MAGTTGKQLYGGQVSYPRPKLSQLEVELKAEAPGSLKLRGPPYKHTNAPLRAAHSVPCP